MEFEFKGLVGGKKFSGSGQVRSGEWVFWGGRFEVLG